MVTWNLVTGATVKQNPTDDITDFLKDLSKLAHGLSIGSIQLRKDFSIISSFWMKLLVDVTSVICSIIRNL